MKNFIFIIFCLLICSCKTQKNFTDTSLQKDSISHEQTQEIKETIKYMPVDSSHIMAMVICPSGEQPVITKIIYRNGNTTHSNLTLNNGVLNVSFNVDSIKQVNTLLTIKNKDYESHKMNQIKYVDVVRTPKFILYSAWFGWLTFTGLILYICKRFKII